MSNLTTTSDIAPAAFAGHMRAAAIEDDGHDELDHTDSLAAELAKGGTLIDPRAPKYRTSALDEYLRSEVQRSVQRIRMLRRIKRPLDGPMPTAAELRRLGRALAKVAFTTTQAMAARELEAVDGEPPDLACAIKYHCASEACYLIGCFSMRPGEHLNSLEGGRFRVVTKTLYEAVTGEADANVSRACDHVLKNWRLYAPKA
jgi:hypothetical protein